MMSSELDYGDLFGEDHEELEGSRTFVRLLFVVFVIFIAIVLMNFMIGVAVSDVNELNVIGNIRRLEKQVELLGTLEVVGNTILGKYVNPLSRVWYHDKIVNNLEFNKKWEVVSTGNDIDKDAEKKQLAKEEDEIEQKKENKLNALYDVVVGMPHNRDRGENYQKLDQKVKSSTPILTEKIKSIEEDLSNVKEAHEELHQKLDELSVLMKDICVKLAIIADTETPVARDGNTSLPAS